MEIRIFFGTPDGCSCHPDYYRNTFTWALYRDERFQAAGRRFNTYQEAYDDGLQFLNDFFPRDQPQPNNEQN